MTKEKVMGTAVLIGIIGTVGYMLFRKKIEGKPLIAPFVPDIVQFYDDALKDIQNRHLTDDNVKDTLKKVADGIATKTGDLSLNLKGVVTVVDEVRDIVTDQLAKLGGGGGSGDYLFT